MPGAGVDFSQGVSAGLDQGLAESLVSVWGFFYGSQKNIAPAGLGPPTPQHGTDSRSPSGINSRILVTSEDTAVQDVQFSGVRNSGVGFSMASEQDFPRAEISWDDVTGDPDAIFVGGQAGVFISAQFKNVFEIAALHLPSIQPEGRYWQISFSTKPGASGVVSFTIWFGGFRCRYTVSVGTGIPYSITCDFLAVPAITETADEFVVHNSDGSSQAVILYYYNTLDPSHKIYENPQILSYDNTIIEPGSPRWVQLTSYPWVFWVMTFKVIPGTPGGTKTTISGRIEDVLTPKTLGVSVNIEVMESPCPYEP